MVLSCLPSLSKKNAQELCTLTTINWLTLRPFLHSRRLLRARCRPTKDLRRESMGSQASIPSNGNCSPSCQKLPLKREDAVSQGSGFLELQLLGSLLHLFAQ